MGDQTNVLFPENRQGQIRWLKKNHFIYIVIVVHNFSCNSLKKCQITNRTKGVIGATQMIDSHRLKEKNVCTKSVCGCDTTPSFFCESMLLEGFWSCYLLTCLMAIMSQNMMLINPGFIEKLTKENVEKPLFQTLRGGVTYFFILLKPNSIIFTKMKSCVSDRKSWLSRSFF